MACLLGSDLAPGTRRCTETGATVSTEEIMLAAGGPTPRAVGHRLSIDR
jgi:hypothetical protein